MDDKTLIFLFIYLFASVLSGGASYLAYAPDG